jgi:hypothetical protein
VASGSVSFGAGVVTRTFTVDVHPDDAAEGFEAFNVVLDSATGGAALGTLREAVVNVTDSEPVVEFSAALVEVSEGAPRVTVTVKRAGSKASAVTVNLSVLGGTATAGDDYGAVPATVVIPAGALTKSFTIPIAPDTLAEPTETVALGLSACTPGCVVGPQSTTTVAIQDNEPSIAWSASSYAAAEPGGSAALLLTVTVKRAGVLSQVSTVDYAVAGVSATEAEDYTLVPPAAASGTLTFAAGVATVTFRIAIVGDGDPEPTETVALTLSNPTGARLGPVAASEVQIADND